MLLQFASNERNGALKGHDEKTKEHKERKAIVKPSCVVVAAKSPG